MDFSDLLDTKKAELWDLVYLILTKNHNFTRAHDPRQCTGLKIACQTFFVEKKVFLGRGKLVPRPYTVAGVFLA